MRADGELHLLRAIREVAVLRRRIATTDVRMQVAAPTAPVELWADLHARLRAFVGRRVADPHAADDIAQEVLLRLHRSLGDLRAEDRLDAFAYRIARNAIIDHYRAGAAAKETPTPPDVVTAGLDHAVTSEDAHEAQAREQLARCLEPLVARLAEPYRQALTLTDLGDLSQVEAARRVGLSVPGMKARVQRARVQIRDLLTECCRVTLDESRHIADVERAGPCACTPD